MISHDVGSLGRQMRALPEVQAWAAEIDGREMRRGARLRPSSEVTTVRVRDGETLVSDGPFAETKEQMGGFDILECAGLEDAIAIAAKHPASAGGSIEGPLWEG